MSGSYLKVVKDNFKAALSLVCFDRFHVSQLFNKALDKVRREEYQSLTAAGKENPLKKARYGLLKNSNLTDNRSSKRKDILSITRMHLKTARAWQMKETANTLWNFTYMGAAEKNWKSLLWWLSHCRIPEMVKVGRTVKKHLWGILNAIRLQTTNALSESVNNSIQRIKRLACGFRNKKRFITDILFHFGGLDMAFASP